MASIAVVKRETDVATQMERQGFAVVASPGVMTGAGPTIAHTIGMTDKGLPEIILEGIVGPEAIDLLGSVASFLVDEGTAANQIDKLTLTVPDMGTEVYLLLMQPKAGARKAPLACKDGREPDFVQMCIRDRNGRWPWEASFEGGDLHRVQLDGAVAGVH